MNRPLRWGAALILIIACRDLTLVDPPVMQLPKPGSLSGRVVIAEPGRPGSHPIAGVQVEILGTGLFTASDSDGFFRIDGITSDAQQVLFRLDTDRDGKPDRQKLLSLQALKGGLGKDISVGDILLAANASLKGQVLRDDVTGTSGHAGTLVFVPIGPYQTSTGDDGSFLLSELPEGTISIAFFRPGYAPYSFDSISLSGGEEVTLRTVRLAVATTMPPAVRVSGRVMLSDGSKASAALVRLESTSPTVMTNAGSDGSFTFTNVSSGIYTISASYPGAYDGRLSNILIDGTDYSAPDLTLGLIPMGGTGGGGGTAGGTGTGGGTAGGTAGGGTAGGGTAGGGTAGGGTAGGGTAGGGTAGGGTAGGGTAGGGTAGGGTAGGGTAGGGTAGGSAGGTAGGTVSVPAAPTNLQALPGSGQLTLTFAPSSGATSHTLYWSTQPAVSKTNGTAIANVMSPYLHQGLTNGTAYYYVVTAKNAAGESVESASTSGIPAVPSPTALNVVLTRPDTDERGVAQGVPILLRFNKPIAPSSVNGTTVTLTGPSGPVGATRTTVANTITLTPTAALAAETQYTLAVTTGLQDTSGNPLAAAFTSHFTTASPAPAMLRAVVGNNAVTLIWNAVPGATSYVLERASSAGAPADYSFVATGPSYLDTGVANGTPYYYRVTARTAFGTTPRSNEVNVIPSPARPYTPTGVRVRAAKSTALVEWDGVSGATGYTLYRGTSSLGPLTLVTSAHPYTAYFDTNLTGTNVFYVVQAESAAGPSAYSREAAGTLDPALAPAPGNLMSAPGFNWLRLTWSPVPSATGYVILRIADANGDPQQVGWVTNGTSFDALGLSNGTTYRHYVGAVTNGVLGDLVETIDTPGPTLAPSPPVLGQPVGNVNAITLSWSNTAGTTSATVLRSTTSGSGYMPIGSSAYDSTVTPGTRYYYRVRCDNGTSQGLPSNEVSAVALAAGTPGVPMSPGADAADGLVTVRWAPVADATQYSVDYAMSPGGPYVNHGCDAVEPFETRCTLGATNGTRIYIVVRSYNGAYSGYSSEVSALPTSQLPMAGLATPSVGAYAGNGGVTLTWPAVVSATTYHVYRRTYLSDWTELTAQASTLYLDTTALNGTNYKYAVQAVNPSGPRLSAWGFSGYVQPSPRLPAQPTGFTIEPVKNGFMASWAPIPGAIGYLVRAGLYAGASVSVASNGCSTSSPYETRCFFGATNGTPYFISMVAQSPEGYSLETDEQMAMPDLNAPPAPSVSYYSGNSSISALAGVVSGASSYRFYRRTRFTDWQQLADSPVPLLVLPVVTGTEVQLGVRAVSSTGVAGEWSYSSGLSPQFDRPPAITGVTVTPANGEVLLSWDPLPGAAAYVTYLADGPGLALQSGPQPGDAFDTHVAFPATNGMSRYATVRAYNVNIPGDYSPLAQPFATPSASLPTTPSVSLFIGNEAMGLDWPDVTGATGYRIYRRTPGHDWALLLSVTGSSFIDYDVQNAESFRYAVQAVSGAGLGGWGFTTMSAASATVPRAPDDVRTQPGNDAVQVEWAPVAGATGYNVYSAPSQLGPYGYAGATNSMFENRVRVTGTNGQALWVVVTASGAGGTSVSSLASSAIPSATLPVAVAYGSATAAGSGTLALSWPAATGATSYRVYRRPDTATATFVTSTAMTSLTDMGLVSGSNYTYYVESENMAGRGAWSPPFSAAAP